MKHTLTLLSVLLLAPLAALHADEKTEPIDIGSRKQLLIDDYVIAVKKGVQRVMQAGAFLANRGQCIRKPLRASIYASPTYDTQRGVFRMSSRVDRG